MASSDSWAGEAEANQNTVDSDKLWLFMANNHYQQLFSKFPDDNNDYDKLWSSVFLTGHWSLSNVVSYRSELLMMLKPENDFNIVESSAEYILAWIIPLKMGHWVQQPVTVINI